MLTANGNAIAGGAITAALIDLLVTKGVLDQAEIGNLIASASARLVPLGQSTDIQAAKEALAGIAEVYSGSNG